MITDKQKKEFVEQMLTEFTINKKFREALTWLIGEIDKTYEKCIQQRIDEAFKEFWHNIDNPPPPLKGKLVGKYKLVKIN